MTPESPSQAGSRLTLTALETLARELTARGWITRLDTPPERLPSLYVQNPDPAAAILSEHIYASPLDGAWWYWWPWAEKVAPAASASQAADAIVRVLRTADAGSPR